MPVACDRGPISSVPSLLGLSREIKKYRVDDVSLLKQPLRGLNVEVTKPVCFGTEFPHDLAD